MSDIALKHIEHLSVTVGPRGSTTSKEREGHDYVRKVLTDLNCAPRVESFMAATSTYSPFILGLGLVLVAEALYWLVGGTPNASVGALVAALLGLLLTASLLLELWPADNPLRWFLPVAPSQNVIGVTPPSGEARRKVAVLAHVDTHRTPLFWRSRTTFTGYRVITTLGILSLLALDMMYLIGIFNPSPGLRTTSLVPTALVAAAWLMVVQAHNTKFTAGANDNASGVGVMLALAERLKSEPLQSTEVWWVATGCEEVGAYGSADFVRRYHAELAPPGNAAIVLDNIAGQATGPVFLSSETLLLPARYPAEMTALAAQVAADHPALGGRPHAQQGAYTDGIYALKAGLKCLTFVGYTRDGWIPHWHNASDVFAHVDPEAVERTEQFVMHVLKQLDAA